MQCQLAIFSWQVLCLFMGYANFEEFVSQALGRGVCVCVFDWFRRVIWTYDLLGHNEFARASCTNVLIARSAAEMVLIPTWARDFVKQNKILSRLRLCMLMEVWGLMVSL